MFCLKCGEAIPDGSEKCPLCGVVLKSESSEQTVVDSFQKEPPKFSVVNETENNLKNLYIGVVIAAICSFIFLSMSYMRIKLLYSSVTGTNFTGYYLAKSLSGTGNVKLSGWMVILLIIVNIATIITAIIGIKGSLVNKDTLRKIILIEDILYIISTVIPLSDIMNILEGFDPSVSSTGIGIGCYLNIAVAVFMVIVYFLFFSKKLHT